MNPGSREAAAVLSLVPSGRVLKFHSARIRVARRASAWRASRDPLPRGDAIPRLAESEHLRFGRRCARLRIRPPDDEIGRSILIFRLTDAAVRALLEGPPPFSR